MAEELEIGTIVRTHKKTGTYIGEITAIREKDYLVRVLAAVKHPMQGDLHNPKDGDVPFFHERKALAYREQTPVPKNMTKPFVEEIPDYQTSLKIAYDKLRKELEQDDSVFAMKSLRCLDELAKEYFK